MLDGSEFQPDDPSVGRRSVVFEAAVRAGYITPDFRRMVLALLIIQGVSGGIVNILGGGSMGYSE